MMEQLKRLNVQEQIEVIGADEELSPTDALQNLLLLANECFVHSGSQKNVEDALTVIFYGVKEFVFRAELFELLPLLLAVGGHLKRQSVKGNAADGNSFKEKDFPLAVLTVICRLLAEEGSKKAIAFEVGESLARRSHFWGENCPTKARLTSLHYDIKRQKPGAYLRQTHELIYEETLAACENNKFLTAAHLADVYLNVDWNQLLQ